MLLLTGFLAIHTVVSAAVPCPNPERPLDLDRGRSVIRWRGTKFWGLGKHEGTVRFRDGRFCFREGRVVSGWLEADMRTIEVTDIPADDPIPRTRLRNHLLSPDFFYTATFPVARFVLRSIEEEKTGLYRVTGELTIKNRTNPLTFYTRGWTVTDQHLRAEARIEIERHRYDVSYRGSTLKDDLVDDTFWLDLVVEAGAPAAARRGLTVNDRGNTFALAGGVTGNGSRQDCDGCGVREAPENLRTSATIPPSGEPGTPLVISGTVFLADGRTPAAGVIVYAYHTNAEGRYPKRGDETGYARWHGYLRGWVITGPDGRFEFRTIRPGTYPEGGEPAHLHMEVRPSGKTQGYAIADLVDERDPLVTAGYRARASRSGGSGIVRFIRNVDGTWRAKRNIVLERETVSAANWGVLRPTSWPPLDGTSPRRPWHRRIAANKIPATDSRPDSDGARARAFVKEKGWTLGPDVLTERLVWILDSPARNELMLIYMEDLADHGLTAADLAQGGKARERWPAMAAAFHDRAVGTFRVPQ